MLVINSKINTHWLMILTIILAASSFPIGAAITHDIAPAIMMCIRFLLAAFLFLPYVFIKNNLAFPPWKNIFHYIILSAPLAIFFWCMFESLRYTSILNTGALYTLVPAITAVCALLINREITNKLRSFGLFLGTIGALWIVFRGDYSAFISLELNYGDLIFIVGCLFLGLYNPLVKKFYSGEPMEVMTFWVLLFGAGWLLLVSGTSILNVDWYNIDNNVYGGILYLALFSTLITFFLLQLCVVRIGATKVAAYGLLTPILVIIMSIFTGNDKFELIILPGIILVFLGLVIIQQDSKFTPLEST